ncbi:hypothetical protein J45TS6_20980 [Paenibacillus sp. J45TS6]|nr:hypothetical protein J45TS6_20980 [Paenibacillus sp. J45TS6]
MIGIYIGIVIEGAKWSRCGEESYYEEISQAEFEKLWHEQLQLGWKTGIAPKLCSL